MTTIDDGKRAEFYSEKPKTIICDIDGTILKHMHRFTDVAFLDAEVLDGVQNMFNKWDSLNHKIILMTARKESAREMTEKDLKKLGLMWDHLIMGVNGGVRVLINDKLQPEDNDRAIAVNLITNEGFEYTDWESIGL
jgi:hydroxymethylpyrimidine pyrophosphatase-like HAD family hydrolase